MIFVLDNSVAMRWCFNEGHPYADPILEKLETGDTATVPAMWLQTGQNPRTFLHGGRELRWLQLIRP